MLQQNEFHGYLLDLKSDRKDLAYVLKEQGVHDIVTFEHAQKPVWEEQTIPEKKRWFGLRTEPAFVKTVRKADEPAKHSDLVENGNDEPAVRMRYSVQGRWMIQEDSGPSGGMGVEAYIPESLAKQVEAKLERDPSMIREISDRIMKEKFLDDPERWDKPNEQGWTFRPPYEQFDASPEGGNIYIQKEGATPGFHEEFVHPIKNVAKRG
jgi:hypothetical protein